MGLKSSLDVGGGGGGGYKANKLRSKMSFLYGHCIVTIVFPTYYPNTCIQVIAAMRF